MFCRKVFKIYIHKVIKEAAPPFLYKEWWSSWSWDPFLLGFHIRLHTWGEVSPSQRKKPGVHPRPELPSRTALNILRQQTGSSRFPVSSSIQSNNRQETMMTLSPAFTPRRKRGEQRFLWIRSLFNAPECSEFLKTQEKYARQKEYLVSTIYNCT